MRNAHKFTDIGVSLAVILICFVFVGNAGGGLNIGELGVAQHLHKWLGALLLVSPQVDGDRMLSSGAANEFPTGTSPRGDVKTANFA